MTSSASLTVVTPQQQDIAVVDVGKFRQDLAFIRSEFHAARYETGVKAAATMLNFEKTGNGPFRVNDPDAKRTMKAAGFTELSDLLTSPQGLGLDNFQEWSRLIKAVNVMERFGYPKNSDPKLVLREAEEAFPPHKGDIMDISDADYWRQRTLIESNSGAQQAGEVTKLNAQLARQTAQTVTLGQELDEHQARINTLVSCFNQSPSSKHNDIDALIEEITETIGQSGLAEKHELLKRIKAFTQRLPKILKGAQIQKKRFEAKKAKFSLLCNKLKHRLIGEVNSHNSLKNHVKLIHVVYLTLLLSAGLTWMIGSPLAGVNG